MRQFGKTFRRDDFALSADDELVRDTFEIFFRKEIAGLSRSHIASTGIDQRLWQGLMDLGVVEMFGQPHAEGGVTLLQAVLIAEEYGRVIAPVPLIETLAAVFMLKECRTERAAKWLADMAKGDRIVTLALQPIVPDYRQIVPAGGVAQGVICLSGNELVLAENTDPEPVKNCGDSPVGWLQHVPQQACTDVLATGTEAAALHARGVNIWKLLTAAALSGLAIEAATMGAEFSRTRTTKGVPIGSLQGVSFPLVDAYVAACAARNLTRKAAWLEDNDPPSEPLYIDMAYAQAAQAATKSTLTSVHVHGGFGVDSTSDISRYNRTAKFWSSLAPAENTTLARIGKSAVSQVSSINVQTGFV